MSAWSPADYAPIVGEGAVKLYASAVAPLVAYAQGLTTITGANVAAFNASIGRDGRSGRALIAACATGDAMAMPWHTPGDVVGYWASRNLARAHGMPAAPARVSSWQIRPHSSSLRVDRKGKPEGKYLVLSNLSSVLCVHPATPTSWLSSTPATIALTEGLIKALSLTTAFLIEAGIDSDDLMIDPGEDIHAARDRLSALMDTIEPERRFLVIGMVGVGNWHQNPEWNAVDVRNRTFYVALDGDIETNPAVARQAGQLHQYLTSGSRNADAKMIHLASTAGYQPKDGIDDVLARGIPLHDLLAAATTDFPPPNPPGTEGRWRMNETTLTTQKFEPNPDGDGGRWLDVYPYVARVSEVVRPRFVTPQETITGTTTPRSELDQAACTVTVEFAWLRGQEIVTRKLHGNQNMLWTVPDRWTAPQVGVVMPTEHFGPDPLAFPPTHKEFTGAMMGYRDSERVYRTAWQQMGWLPMDDGCPVMAMGDVVIGANGLVDPDSVHLGIDDSVMSGWRSFGMILPGDDDDARSAVRATLNTYFPEQPEDYVWTDPRNAAIALAAGLRPVVPVRCASPLYITGGTNLGKSYTSAAIMAFWQPTGGVWTPNRLPGSAKDTQTAQEMMLARSPIWVTDDVAPNGHDTQAQRRTESAVDEMLRAVHNGHGRLRATSSLGSAQVFKPIALLVVSAEQSTEVPSILNRVVPMRVARGFLNPSRVPTDRLDRVSSQGIQATVTGYAVRMMARRIAANGWAATRQEWQRRMDDNAASVSAQMDVAGGSQRPANVVADLMLGLDVLSDVIADLGMEDEFGDRLSALYAAFDTIANDGASTAQSYSLGTIFLSRLRSVLSAHGAHIGTPSGSPGAPMPVGPDRWGQRAETVNTLLGWTPNPDGPRPGGKRIGVLVFKDGEPAIVFDKTAAYQVAVQGHTDALSASRDTAAWEGIHREGLSSPRWGRKQQGNGQPSILQRVSVGGVSVTGIVIELATLLDVDDAPETTAP